MELILKKDVEHLGFTDDVVTVKPGYGRNFLIPNGMAIMATPGAKKQLAETIKQRAHKEANNIKLAQEQSDKLNGLEVKIAAKTGDGDKLFGSVTTQDLADALAKQGVELDKKFITVAGGNIKRLGQYEATLRFHREVTTAFTFDVVGAKNQSFQIRIITKPFLTGAAFLHHVMKYRRLTKEQLEELHPEFINFLATQTITAAEWDDIKANKPEVAEQEIDVFSDLVWEGVLTKAKYLEHISPQTMNLFHLQEKEISLISVMVGDELIDITTKEGYAWLQKNLMDDTVKLFTAVKKYSDDPNGDKFKLIEQGAIITKGDLFNYFDDLMELGKEKNGF